MKKMLKMLATMALFVVGMTCTAYAEETKINETFFPNGNMSEPNAPYVRYVDEYDDGTPSSGSTNIYFDIPEELLKLNAEYALLGEEAFNEKYNTPMRYDCRESLNSCIQIDTKFDDGPWLSESGNWDRFDYGENMDGGNLNYRLSVGRYIDETSKLFSFEQSWLTYNDIENEYDAFLQPYLKSFKDDNDEIGYQLDLDNHTFSYRVRFVVYTNDWENLDEGEEAYWCISDWSPVASIGKNGTQETLEEPTKVEAPILSDFNLIKNEDNGVEARYYVEFTKYTYDSVKYYSAIADYFEPFYIESQIRVDGGEWVDTYTANAADLCGGYRSTDSNDVEITMDSQVEVRVRIVCSAMDSTPSEWSNIVGNKPADEIEPTTQLEENLEEETVPETTVEVTTEKNKCKVCGICPVQPLGICLFIWILIIVIAIVIVVVIIVIRNKKDKDEKKNNKSSSINE